MRKLNVWSEARGADGRVRPAFSSTKNGGQFMKITHVLLLTVLVFACIWASNNVPFVENIVG
jgi:hypothetical protein